MCCTEDVLLTAPELRMLCKDCILCCSVFSLIYMFVRLHTVYCNRIDRCKTQTEYTAFGYSNTKLGKLRLKSSNIFKY